MNTVSKIAKLMALMVFIVGTFSLGIFVLALFEVDIDRFLNE